MKTVVLLNRNDLYLKYGIQHDYLYGYYTYGSSLLVSKECLVL